MENAPEYSILPFYPNVVPAPEFHHSVATLAPDREVIAQSYPIRTVFQFSKYNWGYMLRS